MTRPRCGLMVVPPGLADSLNPPALMGLMGATGLVPRDGEGRASLTAGGEGAGPAKGTAADVATGGPPKGP